MTPRLLAATLFGGLLAVAAASADRHLDVADLDRVSNAVSAAMAARERGAP
jgi:hypothetical protein